MILKNKKKERKRESSGNVDEENTWDIMGSFISICFRKTSLKLYASMDRS